MAGVVFIVGAIFFSGFALGKYSGHGGGFGGPGHSRHQGGGMDMPRPPMGGRGDGPGMMGPGMMGPGMMGPGMMGPGGPGMRPPVAAQTPAPTTSAAPAPAAPRP